METALVLPLLMGMILAAVGFTTVYTNRGIMVHAAEVGAYKGAVTRSAASCVNAVRGAATGLTASKLTVTCTSTWTAGADVVVTVGYPWAVSFLLFNKSGTTHYTTKDVVR